MIVKNKFFMFKVILFLLLILMNFTIRAEKKILERQEYVLLNEKTEKYIFKSGNLMYLYNKQMYFTDNYNHRILKYDLLENNKLKFSKIIGKKGQGPGDFNLPTKISIWNNTIAVRDEIGFSFFDTDGKYLDKFRFFLLHNDFTFTNNKIYYLNSNIDKKHLFEVYSREGRKLLIFGENQKQKNLFYLLL